MSVIEDLRRAILAQGPTGQQRDAIFAVEEAFLLRAAPGSGKTWTSCRRFVWRGAQWPYRCGGLALLSFTNAAISEFKKATQQLGRAELLFDPNYVGTFDSFVERHVLAPFGHLITGSSKRPKLFPGPRPGDWKNSNLIGWVQGAGGRQIRVPAWEVIPYFENKKRHFRTTRMFGNKDISQGFEQIRHLMSRGFYTHSQRVFWACQLLVERPHIAEVLARRFPEIIVDEAQDTNAWLLVLLNYIRNHGARITLIGDPDQCIYEFSMADVTSLPDLKEKWGIPEKPLSRSFRCNNNIATAVRSIGGNDSFTGCGDGSHETHRAFVVRESSAAFANSVIALQSLTQAAGIDLTAAAIVCRGHSQLESIRGTANYNKLKGKTKSLATAAFMRDSRNDYRGAFQVVQRIVREITGDDPLWNRIEETPDSDESMALDLSLWRFVKDPLRLPSLSHAGSEWVQIVRRQLEMLISEIGVAGGVKLGRQIKRTGLPERAQRLPLFEAQEKFPSVRQSTIHQVKGESIDSVLVVASAQFWNSVVGSVSRNRGSEDRRLAYVAMTRARHQLIVGLPEKHFDKHVKTWLHWGFAVFQG